MPLQRVLITPSARLGVSLSAVHLAAGVAAWLAPVPLWLKATLTLAMAISAVYFVSRTAGLRDPEAVVALETTDDGRISFQTRRGEWQECEVLGSSYVSPRLTILNLKLPGVRRVRHVVLVHGNVDAGDFRRLRIWLRWAAQSGSRHDRRRA